MPIQKCTSDGKPGYKWGEEGKCYTYISDNEASRKAARKKAHKQGIAFEFAKYIISRIKNTRK